MKRNQVLRASVIICTLVLCSLPSRRRIVRRGRPATRSGWRTRSGPPPGSAARTHLANPEAKSYELSHVRSNTMPQSPFAVPLRENAKPTVGIPGTRHAFNTDEVVSGDPGQQGTQMDALGHFAVLPRGVGRQGRVSVRPRHLLRRLHAGRRSSRRPNSPLRKLGIDKVPPIVTTAVLLDAKAHLGRGNAHAAGRSSSPRRTSRRCSRRRGWRAAAWSPATCSTSTPAGATTGKTPTPRSSTTPRGRASPTTRPSISSRRPWCWWRSTIRSPIRWPKASCRARRRRPRARRPACRSRSTTTISRSGRHPQHPERQPRGAGAGQGLAVLHHHPAAAHARRVRLAGAAGRDRRAGTIRRRQRCCCPISVCLGDGAAQKRGQAGA